MTVIFMPELHPDKICGAKHPGHGNVTCTKLADHVGAHSNGYETWEIPR